MSKRSSREVASPPGWGSGGALHFELGDREAGGEARASPASPRPPGPAPGGARRARRARRPRPGADPHADLALARHAHRGGHHEWACFAAQQSAEKAAEAAHERLGREAWGHSVTELLDALRPDVAEVDVRLLDRGRALDKLYVATRYPNGLPKGAPADYFTAAEAERALDDAEAVLELCRRVVSR